MASDAPGPSSDCVITYRQYRDERDLPIVMRLIDVELSEPYSIFTYRYFLTNWPELCFIAYATNPKDASETPFGTVVCKSDIRGDHMRGYLAMLVVDKAFRAKGVGRELVKRSIAAMIAGGCDEIVLEAEVGNTGALALYQSLGFIRDKRLHRYYLNGVDAYRLKLLLPLTEEKLAARQAAEAQEEEGLADLGAAMGAMRLPLQA